MSPEDEEYLWKITGAEPVETSVHQGEHPVAEDYVPEYMQPFTPVPFELPELGGMRLMMDHPWMGGRHVEVRMRNGWGVSIVNHWGAYGGLEVGFRPPGPDAVNLLGTPPFHNDEVMGHLDQQTLIEVLTQVHHLPKE